MATTTDKALRIGEVAELTGLTPRTIRYYEEIGLLGEGSEREQGKHRVYTDADVDRINEIVRLKNLLGLSLEQLLDLVEAETARAALRKEYHETEDPAERRRILEQILPHIEHQLELVQTRKREIAELEKELLQKQALVTGRLLGLGDAAHSS